MVIVGLDAHEEKGCINLLGQQTSNHETTDGRTVENHIEGVIAFEVCRDVDSITYGLLLDIVDRSFKRFSTMIARSVSIGPRLPLNTKWKNAHAILNMSQLRI